MTTQAGFVPHGRNVMTVRVTSYEGRCLKGIMGGAPLEEDVLFTSAIDLLLQLEALMDRTQSSQRNEEPRLFPGAVRQDPDRLPVRERTSAIATFQINVMFRQNATWQGSLFWVDQSMEAHFRSVAELLRLMDSALSAGNANDR